MQNKETATPGERKPYTPPVLTEYGSVEELTRGGHGQAQDFPAGTSRSG
jgi:hypothetical protein